MQILIAIGLAGAAGALCRHGLSQGLQALWGAGMPWPTLTVNVTGCLLFGLLWSALWQRMDAVLAAALFTGFLGSFTTFSTFANETVVLLREGHTAIALLNLLLHNALGCGAVVLGLWTGRLL